MRQRQAGGLAAENLHNPSCWSRGPAKGGLVRLIVPHSSPPSPFQQNPHSSIAYTGLESKYWSSRPHVHAACLRVCWSVTENCLKETEDTQIHSSIHTRTHTHVHNYTQQKYKCKDTFVFTPIFVEFKDEDVFLSEHKFVKNPCSLKSLTSSNSTCTFESINM